MGLSLGAMAFAAVGLLPPLAGAITQEVIDVIASYRRVDFVFGLASNAVLLRQAASTIEAARRLHHQRVAVARAHGQGPPPGSRLYDEFHYAAGSWGPEISDDWIETLGAKWRKP